VEVQVAKLVSRIDRSLGRENQVVCGGIANFSKMSCGLVISDFREGSIKNIVIRTPFGTKPQGTEHWIKVLRPVSAVSERRYFGKRGQFRPPEVTLIRET
jgi:hypothetical protein